MKVNYDPETDTLTIRLREERIKESDEVRPGLLADYGYDGGIISFEVLQASKVVDKANEMQFAVSAPATVPEGLATEDFSDWKL